MNEKVLEFLNSLTSKNEDHNTGLGNKWGGNSQEPRPNTGDWVLLDNGTEIDRYSPGDEEQCLAAYKEFMRYNRYCKESVELIREFELPIWWFIDDEQGQTVARFDDVDKCLNAYHDIYGAQSGHLIRYYQPTLDEYEADYLEGRAESTYQRSSAHKSMCAPEQMVQYSDRGSDNDLQLISAEIVACGSVAIVDNIFANLAFV